MKRFGFIFLTLLALTSCSTYTALFVDNNYQLKRATSTLNPEGSKVNNQSYNDEYLTIELLQVTNDCIFLTLVNNHTSTIRILWDEAAFVDFNGYSHRITHDNSAITKKLFGGKSVTNSDGKLMFSTHGGGVVDVDEAKVQIPTVIPAGSRVNTVIIPADDASIVRFENIKEISLHKTEGFEEQKAEERVSKILSEHQAYSAKTAIKLLLPIEVDGKKIEYTATFMDEFQMYSTTMSDDHSPALLIFIPFSIILMILGGL